MFGLHPLLGQSIAQGGILRYRQAGKIAIEVRILGIVEEGHESVVILVGIGVIRMGMTLHAAKGGALPCRPGRIHTIHHRRRAKLFITGSTLGIVLGIPVKSRSQQMVRSGFRQQVARELTDGEFIKGHVTIEGADHPIPPRPDVPVRVFFITVSVRITCQIQPHAGPAFAKGRR